MFLTAGVFAADEQPSVLAVKTAEYSVPAEQSDTPAAKPEVQLRWLAPKPGDCPDFRAPATQPDRKVGISPKTGLSSSVALPSSAPPPADNRVIPAGAFTDWKPVARPAAKTFEHRKASADLLPDDPTPIDRAEMEPSPGASKPATEKPTAEKPGTTDGNSPKLTAAPAPAKSDAVSGLLQWTPPKTNPSPPPSADSASQTLPPAQFGAEFGFSKPAEVAEKCHRPSEVLKPIAKISTDIEPERGDFPLECPVTTAAARPTGPTGERIASAWRQTTFTWTATAMYHKPLYFEEVQLERYGHTVGPLLQPIVSSAHFFVTVPLLPYLMGVEPPGECMYTLGYYRPGDCAPYMLDPFPISVRGALFEGMAWTGAAFIF